MACIIKVVESDPNEGFFQRLNAQKPESAPCLQIESWNWHSTVVRQCVEMPEKNDFIQHIRALPCLPCEGLKKNTNSNKTNSTW